LFTVTSVALPFIASIIEVEENIRGTAVELFMQSGPMGKVIILVLVLISIVSWSIIIERYITFSKAHKEGLRFETIFREMKNLNEVGSHIQSLKRTPLTRLFITGYNDFKLRQKKMPAYTKGEDNASDYPKVIVSDEIEGIARSLEKVSALEVTRLESRLIFLATVGAVSPFIGLFGTVWGIMNSFRGISVQSSASFVVIASGISEALIATAAGLAAAIPAVIAYNYFVNRIKVFITQMEAFSWDFLNIVERWIKKKSA
jgi:biopolymer transport protein TolQ